MFKFLFSKRNRNFFRLWLAQLISQFGDRIHQLALVGLIAERTPGSTMSLAKLMTFTILPAFILQPIAGVYVDRWDRRNTLFFCDIVRGILVLLIPLVFIQQTSMVPIYIIVFLVFCFPRFYVPAKMSVIPELVNKQNLLKANSLITTTGMIAAGMGAVLGAFIIEHFGARDGFIIDAFTFFFSAVLIIRMRIPTRKNLHPSIIRKSTAKIVEAFHHTFFREIKEGWQYITSHRDIKEVIQILFTLFAAAGAVYVVIIVFIQKTFNSVTLDLGILAISLVTGLFAGVIFFGRLSGKINLYKIIYICMGLGGVVLIVFAQLVELTASLKAAMAISFLWGLVIAPIFVATNTIVHQVSDENMRGKVFSAMEMVIHSGFLLTMLLSSWASTIVGEGPILNIVGVLCAIAAVLGLARGSKRAIT